jgi:hypothetical protein
MIPGNMDVPRRGAGKANVIERGPENIPKPLNAINRYAEFDTMAKDYLVIRRAYHPHC